MTEAEYDKFLHQQLVGIDYIRAPIMRRAFEQRHELLEALKDYVTETDRVGLSLRGVDAKKAALDAIRKAEGGGGQMTKPP